MLTAMKIDFVSDVACPWCAVGLGALEAALVKVGDEIRAEMVFQPFELNPDMPPEGEDTQEHLAKKYGSTPEQSASIRKTITARGAEVGFTFNLDNRTRIYNTFDAHRLLHWAHLEGRQSLLKKALLKAYFTDGKNPSDPAVLVAAAQSAGLSGVQAQEILEGDHYGAEVRERERFYQSQGINSVPAVIFNDRHLISGGQPTEVFERALRQIAKSAA